MNDWRVAGTIVLACNCDWGCPCNFNARPTRGHCEGGWIWQIEQGHVDSIRLDGLAIALFSDWPGAIHEGGGRAVCYIDERADAAQRDALTRLLKGELGGPWGIFKNTYELAEPQALPFDVDLSGYDTRLRIGNCVDLGLQKMRNPVTQAEVHPEIVLPEGLVLKRGKLAASRVFRVEDRIRYDHSGQYSAFGSFEYASA